MRLKCIHGYFILSESSVGDISKFVSRFGFSVVPKNDFFTFKTLSTAPRYSIKDQKYLGAQAKVNFEGEPWEVMKANGLIYDFSKDQVTPIATITQKVSLNQAGNYFLSNGLILPGSLTDEGKRVTDFSAWYSFETSQFRYSEVTFE